MEENQQQRDPRLPVRRRKRKPKWQRMLHKYWPPIRFALLVVIVILIFVLGFSAILKGCRMGSSGSNIGVGETTTAATLSPSEIELQAKELMDQADFIAAGYDYETAINMLTGYEYYEQFPEMATKVSQYQTLDSQLLPYTDMKSITHVFFHSLIVDTARAFDGEHTEDGYNQYMTTCDEFWAMMEEMYARGFVLVSPYDVAYEVIDEFGAHFQYGNIRLPEGKEIPAELYIKIL